MRPFFCWNDFEAIEVPQKQVGKPTSSSMGTVNAAVVLRKLRAYMQPLYLIDAPLYQTNKH
jgi:hypothetical protein